MNDTLREQREQAEQPLFYCYSTTLMHFLKASGLRYEYVDKHRRTGARMWVFRRSDELRALLDEYDERKAAAKERGQIVNGRRPDNG